MHYRDQSLILIVLAGFLWILTACADAGPDSSVDSANQQSSETSSGEIMVIEGTIMEIMESWPLQLSVQTLSGRYHVELLEETLITEDNAGVDPGDLRQNMIIRVEGTESGTNAAMADTIEILGTR